MGCQATVCRVCGGSFPACQIRDGVCATCRAKEQQQQQQAPPAPPPHRQDKPITIP